MNYRFEVEAQGESYYAPVRSGLLKKFVSVGKASDADWDQLDDWRTVATPLNLELPYSTDMFEPYRFASESPISGSVAVQQGKSAAIGVIFGTVLGFADGGIDGYGGMETALQGQDWTDGKLEYRYIPDWWIKVVDERLVIK